MANSASYSKPANTTSLWGIDCPFVLKWTIKENDIDHYGHVNNAAYVKQMETLAWAHSESLGITISDYKDLDRAMIIKTHNIDYLRACHLGDDILTATWISFCDNRLRLNRTFQFINNKNITPVLSANTEYVCATLSSGRPVKMPELFKKIYGNSVQVSNSK